MTQLADVLGKQIARVVTQREKRAVVVEEGGPVSRFTANTIGRVLGIPNLILTSRGLEDPSMDPERVARQERTAKLLEKAEPEALSTTKVRLGGTDIIDDILWRREDPGKPLPWYHQIGGRLWQNPRTSLLGKLLGTVSTPVGNVLASLVRGSHYNPVTDTVVLFSDENPVTEHELGHAIDLNKLTTDGKVPESFLARQWHGLARDLYTIAGSTVLPVSIVQEMRANRLSDEALRKALGENSQEYRERDLRRREVLPGGIGTYVGSLAGAPGALAGLVGGKVYGLYDAAQQRAEYERQNKKKKKRQPRDGDGDGRVYDGTPREREAPRESPQPLRKRGADSRGGALHDELGQTIAKVLAVREKQAAADSSPVIPLMAPVLYPTLGALMAPEGQRMTGARHGLFAGLGLTGGWLGGHLLNDYLAEKGLMSNRGLAANLMSIVPALGLGLGGAYLSSLLGDFQPPKRHGEENREENREEKPRQKQAANPLVMGNPAVDDMSSSEAAEGLRLERIDPWSPRAGDVFRAHQQWRHAHDLSQQMEREGLVEELHEFRQSMLPRLNRYRSLTGYAPVQPFVGFPGLIGNWIKQEPPPAGPVPGGAPAPAFNPKDGPAPAFPPPGAPAPAFNP